jgi:hypothetical protein
MSRTVCLRCDWEPDAIDPPHAATGRCPRCGVGLYVVPDPPAARRSGAPATPAPGPRTARDREISDDRGWAAASSGGRSWGERGAIRAALAAAIVLSLAAAGLRAIAGGGDGRVTPGRPVGTLVYDGVDAGGDRRLWQLDLSTGEIRPGLEFDDVVDLQRVRQDGHIALGFTRQLDDGAQGAYLASSPSVYGHPQPLVQGDLVSWDGPGASVAAARRGTPDGACHRNVSISVADLSLGTRERVYSDRRSCAELLSLARSGVRTSVSVDRDGRVGTFSVGRHILHPEIPGHVLVSSSPQGDLLVTPAVPGDFPGLAPIRSRGIPSSQPVARPTGGTVLYWPGLGGPAPLGREQVVVDRVLAWSDDGSSALVVGDRDSVPSVLITSAVPAARESARVLATVAGPVTGGTLASDGTAYIAMDGAFLVGSGGTAAPLDVPATAPAPVGPVVWLP